MYVLDLFSGIGGFSLGLERAGFQTAAFCEINPFCREVLRKHWPDVPCFEDVRTLDRAALSAHGIGTIDLICGGYPCQPFSAAGKRRGADDDRHLWPEMFRLIRELRPTWVIGENVAGHISMGLDDVLSDLEGAGYATRPFVIPACAVDARHRRDRIWIVANANCERQQQPQGSKQQERRRLGNRSADVADATSGGWGQGNPNSRRNAQGAGTAKERRRPSYRSRWPAEPNVGRVAHGIPLRMDRTKSLGNGLVSDIPEIIGRAIKAIEEGFVT